MDPSPKDFRREAPGGGKNAEMPDVQPERRDPGGRFLEKRCQFLRLFLGRITEKIERDVKILGRNPGNPGGGEFDRLLQAAGKFRKAPPNFRLHLKGKKDAALWLLWHRASIGFGNWGRWTGPLRCEGLHNSHKGIHRLTKGGFSGSLLLSFYNSFY